MKGCIGYSIRVHLTRLRCSASLSWPAAWNPAIRKGTRDSIGDLHRSPNRCNVNVLMSLLHPLHVKSFTSIKKKEKHVSKRWQHFLRCCVMLTSAVPFHIVGRATKPPRRSSGTAVVPCGGTWLSTSPRLSPSTDRIHFTICRNELKADLGVKSLLAGTGLSWLVLSDHIGSYLVHIPTRFTFTVWDLLGLFVNEALCAVAIFDRFSSE